MTSRHGLGREHGRGERLGEQGRHEAEAVVAVEDVYHLFENMAGQIFSIGQIDAKKKKLGCILQKGKLPRQQLNVHFDGATNGILNTTIILTKI